MKPDISISWSLYNDSDYQWIDTDAGLGITGDNLRCAQCSDFLFRSLQALGAKMKCPYGRRKLARVTLVIHKDEFGIKENKYEYLRAREEDMLLAVGALLTGWAYESHLRPMAQEKLCTIIA